MIRMQRREGRRQRVYLDNSAFQIERRYNESLAIGMNTYPYVNGLIWES
jgi:hypothetical protein